MLPRTSLPVKKIPDWNNPEYDMPTELLDLSDQVNDLTDEMPDKRTKDYKAWVKHINRLMSEYNRRVSALDKKKFKPYVLYK